MIMTWSEGCEARTSLALDVVPRFKLVPSQPHADARLPPPRLELYPLHAVRLMGDDSIGNGKSKVCRDVCTHVSHTYTGAVDREHPDG